MAQQMLLWRQDRGAAAKLADLAVKSERPLARLHALCTLDGLKALDPALLRKALADTHPGVRRHAVRLCEGRLGQSAELGTALLERVHDGDAQVRLQLACTLGEWDDPRAGPALAELLLDAGGERYLEAAALSSINDKNFDAVLRRVSQGSKGNAPPTALLESLLSLASAMGRKQALATLLQSVTTPEGQGYSTRQMTLLAALLDRLDQSGSSLKQLREQDSPEMKEAIARLSGLFASARVVVTNSRAAQADRVQAMRLLGRGLEDPREDIRLLGKLLVPQTAPPLQSAAVAALGRLKSAGVSELLLEEWKGYGPERRTQVLDILLGSPDGAKAVLDAIEKKEVPAAEVDAVRRQRLLQHPTASLRRRAARLLADVLNPDRQKVIDSYRAVLSLKGDAERGRPLFTKNCATCHRLADVGNEVGPDLAPLGSKPTEYLLASILDPNRSVEARYVNYIAETKNGRSLTGVLTEETGNSITLVGADGKRQTILRADLESLSSTGLSAMPEGLEKELRPQDVADVIAFLRAPRPAKKR